MPSTEKSSAGIFRGKSLAIHITERCNQRCSYCYIGRRSPLVANRRDIAKAISLVKPNTVFLYGGEPLLYKALVFEIIDSYPNVHFALMTNGLLLDEGTMAGLIRRNVWIFLSLDSPTLAGNAARNMSPRHFERIVGILERHQAYSRITLLNTVGPWSEDLAQYHQMAKALNVSVEYSPVMSGNPCDFWETPFAKNLSLLPSEVQTALTTGLDPRIRKPRLHVDGHLIRGFRQNSPADIGHISQITPSALNANAPPLATWCLGCSFSLRCQMAGMFPEDVAKFHEAGVLQQTFGCQMAKALSK